MDSFYTVANYGKDMVVGFSQNGSVCGKIVGGSSEDVRILGGKESATRTRSSRIQYLRYFCHIFLSLLYHGAPHHRWRRVVNQYTLVDK